MRRIIFFLFLLLFSSYATAYSAMGVAPPSNQVIYQGAQTIEGSFTVFTNGAKNVRVLAQRDLSEYVTFGNGEPIFESFAEDNLQVEYTLDLPENLAPGNYRLILSASQYLTPEEQVEIGGTAAFAAIAHVVKIRVPPPGKFLEGNMLVTPEKIKAGDVAFFTIDLLNFGTEPLENLGTTIVVKNPEGEILSEESTTTLPLLNPTEEGEVRSFWKTEGQTAGTYYAEATFDYGGEAPLELRNRIRIGDIQILINEVRTEVSPGIVKLHVDIESLWNEDIENVFAELEITRNREIIDTIKTSSTNLGAFSTHTLTGFWERGSLPSGNYDVNVRLFYLDREENKLVQVLLTDILNEESSQDNTLLYTIVLLLGVILILNIIWFMSRGNKKTEEKAPPKTPPKKKTSKKTKPKKKK